MELVRILRLRCSHTAKSRRRERWIMVIEKAINWCFWRIRRYQQRGEKGMVSGL